MNAGIVPFSPGWVDIIGVTLEIGQVVVCSTASGRSNSSLRLGTIAKFSKTMITVAEYPVPRDYTSTYNPGHIYKRKKTFSLNYHNTKFMVIDSTTATHLRNKIERDKDDAMRNPVV